ncbi:hypothetical protein BH24ACT11_BH24ACT11_03540 [soil metagenome]
MREVVHVSMMPQRTASDVRLAVPMRTLLIDNHDSFTFNLFQLIAETYGVSPQVLPNDHPDLTASLADGFDAVVISPGPGSPGVTRDIGRALNVIAHSTAPVLGVCLGHQALALLAGARIQPAADPRHGHLSTISHRGTGLFAGLPQGFTAVRYHSLCLPLPVPAPLVVDAWSEDGVVMAVHHRARPWWGVQFHPESVASQQGADLLANFRSLILGSRPAPTSSPPSRVGRNPRRAPARAAATWLLRTRWLPYEVDAGMAFEQLCADRPYAFWLDSCPPGGELSRFSFVGHPDAPGGEVLSYDASADTVAVLDGCGRAHGSAPGGIT